VVGIPLRLSSDSKAAIAFGDEPVNLPVGLYGISEHHVLDEDLAPPQLEVAPAFGEDIRERIAVVDGHQLRSQRRLGRVQRQREPHRFFDLVHELPQPRQPADRRHGCAAVRDAEVG